VSCPNQSRRQTDRSLPTKDDLATYKQILNVEDLVDAATTTTEVESSSQSRISSFTLDKLGDIAPYDVIVVGDTPYDAEAAGKANLRDWCTLWFPEENLRQAGCIAIYQDIAGSAGTLRRVSTQVVSGCCI